MRPWSDGERIRVENTLFADARPLILTFSLFRKFAGQPFFPVLCPNASHLRLFYFRHHAGFPMPTSKKTTAATPMARWRRTASPPTRLCSGSFAMSAVSYQLIVLIVPLPLLLLSSEVQCSLLFPSFSRTTDPRPTRRPCFAHRPFALLFDLTNLA
jgi:hypothetical protein